MTKRRHGAHSERRPLADRVPPQRRSSRLTVRCRCGKVWAPNERVARELNREAAKMPGARPSVNVRYYECEFGSWHWTRAVGVWERIERELAAANPVNRDCLEDEHSRCWGQAWDRRTSRSVPCGCGCGCTDRAREAGRRP